MSTLTPRLNLVKPLTSEFYDISVQNANSDLVDAAPANVTICTSTTRPATPDEGDVLFETDTLNVLLRRSGAWISFNAKSHICTSTTRPASSATYGGFVAYETDTGNTIIRSTSNTAWLNITGNALNIAAGQVITFAPDVTLYRSGANILRTDDDFQISGQSVSRGVLQRGNRITPGTTTTTAMQGFHQSGGMNLTLGRLYEINFGTVNPQSTVATDAVDIQVRFTTNNTTPTTSSPVMPGSEFFCRPTAANSSETNTLKFTYTPTGANEVLFMLLCYNRIAGTGNVNMFASASSRYEQFVKDIGLDPGVTGFNI